MRSKIHNNDYYSYYFIITIIIICSVIHSVTYTNAHSVLLSKACSLKTNTDISLWSMVVNFFYLFFLFCLFVLQTVSHAVLWVRILRRELFSKLFSPFVEGDTRSVISYLLYVGVRRLFAGDDRIFIGAACMLYTCKRARTIDRCFVPVDVLRAKKGSGTAAICHSMHWLTPLPWAAGVSWAYITTTKNAPSWKLTGLHSISP